MGMDGFTDGARGALMGRALALVSLRPSLVSRRISLPGLWQGRGHLAAKEATSVAVVGERGY